MQITKQVIEGQGEGVDAQLPDAQRREEGRVEKGVLLTLIC